MVCAFAAIKAGASAGVVASGSFAIDTPHAVGTKRIETMRPRSLLHGLSEWLCRPDFDIPLL
jgi:hypothetical protein